MRQGSSGLLLFAAFGLLASPVGAQALDAEEILRRLEAQAELSKSAEQGLGETRGLAIVPLDGGTGAAASGETATVTAETAATDTGQTATFATFDPELQVNLQISFAFDSAAIEPSEFPTLDTMCQVISGSDLERVRIVGHTDSSGSAEYNERLSLLRAKEVTRYLTNTCGISAERLEPMGMGERFPLDGMSPDTEANRRVEFQALS